MTQFQYLSLQLWVGKALWERLEFKSTKPSELRTNLGLTRNDLAFFYKPQPTPDHLLSCQKATIEENIQHVDVAQWITIEPNAI